MKITYATPQDVNGWMSLLEQVKENFPGLDKETYQQALIEGIERKEAVVAKLDETIVGTLAFDTENKELTFLAVHPSFRRKGIAKKLVEHSALLFPKETTLKVITYREGDLKGIAARKLYLSAGFECGDLVTIFDYPCQEMNYIVK